MGNFSICHNGTSGSLIEFWREDFTAVLMPWRQDTDTNRPPDWINEALNSRFQPRGLGDELEHARYTARLARLAMEADQASAADVESADCMVELAESRMLAQAA